MEPRLLRRTVLRRGAEAGCSRGSIVLLREQVCGTFKIA